MQMIPLKQSFPTVDLTNRNKNVPDGLFNIKSPLALGKYTAGARRESTLAQGSNRGSVSEPLAVPVGSKHKYRAG